MNELNRALGDIRSIRRQVAEATQFRGYGALTLLVTSLIALGAGALQAWWVPVPVGHPVRYVVAWSGAALLSLAVIAISTLTRTRRIHSGIENEMIRLAAEQFAPSFAAGALLTLVVLRTARANPGSVWMLPGMWLVVYSLGIFSSRRFLPRVLAAAGVWYLGMGLLCVSLMDARALSPWTMTVAFGLGQALIALVLHFFAEEAPDDNDA